MKLNVFAGKAKTAEVFLAAHVKQIITFSLMAFVIFVVYFNSATALSIVVNAPNGGETWLQGTTQIIDFNVVGTNDWDDINASLYYSTVVGSRTNLIKQDLKVTDYVDVNRFDDYDTANWYFTAGTWSLDTERVKDGKSLKCISGVGKECNFETKAGALPTPVDLTPFIAKGKVGFWVWSNQSGYNDAAGDGLYIGSSKTDYKRWNSSIIAPCITVANAWYFCTVDLNAPTSSAGTINWADVNVVFFGLVHATQEFIIYMDKMFAFDSNCLAASYDGNALKSTECSYSWTLPASGDLNNLYIDANANNGTTTSQDSSDGTINFQGFQLKIYDETTETLIQPDTFTVDGNSWLGYCNAGTCTIPNTANLVSGNYDFAITKTSYGNRTFKFYIDLNANADYNVALFPLSTGKNINFKFFAPNQITVLSDYNVTVWNGTMIVGKTITSSTGTAIFYLDANSADNYSFDLNGASNYTYYYVVLRVLVPKDESTQTSISPFGLQIGGIAIIQDANELTTFYDYNMFGNTQDNYLVTINDNNAGTYLSRTILEYPKGNPTIVYLQPYLVSSATGLTSILIVQDPYSKETISNVLVQLTRDFNGSQTVLASNLTDAAGTISFTWLYLQDYNILFYYPDNSTLVFSALIAPKSTTYYAYLTLTTFDTNHTDPINIDTNFSSSSSTHYEEDIELTGMTKVNIKITNGATSKYDQNFTSADANWATGHFEQNISAIDTNSEVVVTTTTFLNSTIKKVTRKTYYFSSNQLIPEIKALPDEIGQMGAMLLALLIAIFCVGGLSRTVVQGSSSTSIIGMVVLGFFCYVEWISVLFYVAMVFAWFSMFMLTKRDIE